MRQSSLVRTAAAAAQPALSLFLGLPHSLGACWLLSPWGKRQWVSIELKRSGMARIAALSTLYLAALTFMIAAYGFALA